MYRILTLLTLFTTLLLAGCGADHVPTTSKPPAGFYVWQQLWSDEVVSAVQAESHDLYLLAAEWNYSSNKPQRTKVHINWSACKKARHVTAVFRIHQGGLSDQKLPYAIAHTFAKLPKYVKSLQLDLDCPERKLSIYHQLLKKVHQLLPPETSLSITALPCHLKNSEFRRIAQFLDYYVIQVHGIEVPKQLEEDCQLMRLDTALSAIEKAEAIGCKYKVALPTYGYRLFFEKKSGKFIRLSAENSVNLPEGTTEKVICANLQELAKVIKRIKKTSTNCDGIIWFRLPILGDKLCLSRDALTQLSKGMVPNKAIKAVTKRTKNGALQINLINSANMDCKQVNLTLHWKSRVGDFGLGSGFNSEDTFMPGILPTKLSGVPPAPGERRNVGWFRSKNSKNLEIEVQCIED